MNKGKKRRFSYDYMGLDAASIKHALANRMIYTVGKDHFTATDRDWLHAATYMVRDRLTERWMETQRSYYRADAKRVYYLSLEFLIGRSLVNSLLNLNFYEETHQALLDYGMELEELAELELEAALGNGGLGRLAACFLDSMATLRLPGYGYGIRYEFGMFRQEIRDGSQVEHPDNWLRYGNPWEFSRPEVLYSVKFNGHVVDFTDEEGRLCHHWVDTDEVMAMAYDTPVPGYAVETVNNLRLWSAKASRDFDLQYFNIGDYVRAVEDKTYSENLSKVLYPNDATAMGKELRLRQEYFFVSASIQDIICRYLKSHDDLRDFPEKVAIQLNDTHPAIAVAEMMYQLVDHHHLSWESAWDITRNTFAYTNHTLLPEALETWAVSLLGRVLPRHLQIIYEINHRFLQEVNHSHPGDSALLRRLSLIDEEGEKRVRMAHLAIVGSHKVNGVARLHTELLKNSLFQDFSRIYPEKFVNITNGITPRLWVNQANRPLTALLRQHVGQGWLTDLDRLQKLAELADDEAFRAEFRATKQSNKERLAELIHHHLGLQVDPRSMFDVQVKRIHEYKRQLLNLLHVITLYNRMCRDEGSERVARTVIFAGKAAPGYQRAKEIVRLINDVADTVNHDPRIKDRLKVVFIPNYDVNTACDIIPAADLSEQISTAGTEASGTGNMKLAVNGALTIGTLDGANVEIREAVGEDNIFIFGHTVQEVNELLSTGYRPRNFVDNDPELQQALEMLQNGYFTPEQPDRNRALIDELLQRDQYLLLADYRRYITCQEAVDKLYQDPEAWTRKAILNVAHMGRFSSDRSIRDYAENIWNVRPLLREM